jgi:peptidoglycan hydrolase CwlO-like protein
MSELDTFENAFLIFTNAISNFENQLEKTDYKQEDIKLLVFQTKNKLKNLYQDISDELDRVEQLKNF